MITLVRLRAYWRFLRVLRQFLPLAWAYARDRRRFLLFGRPRRVSPEMQRARAQRLLSSLLTLGPTFIKLGQLLSTRPDVLPPAYVEVLARLQDDVPAAPWEEAREVVESELGPVDDRFETFNTDPISGASLGQVYVARYEGERVAVKVRRPGVKNLVDADLTAVRWTLPLVLFFVDENRAFSMRNLADEFDRTIREEMDYRREAGMLREIKANFVDNDRVVMPEVVEECSTGRVLTMEYIEGTKITRVDELDRKGIDRSRLAETLQRVYLKMLVEDGVFHADPHPGNLAVTDDGRVVFYDFGMSGRVEPFIQDRIVEFYRAVANKDIDAILDTLVAMGTLSPEADRGLMAEVMELAIRDARGEQIEQYRVQQVVSQVENTIYEFPLRMPRDLALVLRVATVVEGVCVTLDEDFDFITVATGYLREQGFVEETVRNAARERAQQVRQATGAALRTPPKLERALDRLERGNFEIKTDIEDPDNVLDALARRVVYGLLVAFSALSTTILFVASQFVSAPIVGALTTATVGAAAATAVVTFLLYRNMRGPKGIATSPQFTRQNLRERTGGEGGTPALATDVDEAVEDAGAEEPTDATPDTPAEPEPSPREERATPADADEDDESIDREGPRPDETGDQPRSAADGGLEGADEE